MIQSFRKGAAASGLRLSLCDITPEMTAAWLDSFNGVKAVEIMPGDLLDTADAIISPANRFGEMSGGVDKRIDDYYQSAAQEAITARIREPFLKWLILSF